MFTSVTKLTLTLSLAAVVICVTGDLAQAKEAKPAKTTAAHGEKKAQKGKETGGQSSPDMLTDIEAGDLATTALAALESGGATPDSVANQIEKKLDSIRASRSSSAAATTQPATMPSSMSRLTPGQLQVLGRTIDTRFVAGVRGQALCDAIRAQVKGMLEAGEEKAGGKGAKEPKPAAKAKKPKS